MNTRRQRFFLRFPIFLALVFLALVFLALANLLMIVSAVSAENWTRFRGPNGAGVAQAEGIPTKWTEEDYNWRVRLPGIGHSSPVVWGNRIFINSGTPDEATRHVICLNTKDGSLIWQRNYKTKTHHLHKLNSFGSSTPALDADHVYVVWATPEKITLRALDHQGRDVWSRDLGPFNSQHGFGTSPIVYKDLVILSNDQFGSGSLIAVDRKTGKVRWNTKREFRRTAYSVPCVYRPKNGPDQLIFNSGKNGITGVDPENGKQLWSIDLFDKRSVSSPIIVGDLIFGSCGSGGGGNYIVAIRPPDPKNGRPDPEKVYEVRRSAPYVPTPVAKGNLVFLFSDKATVVTCLDAPTGKVHFQKRLGGNFYGSPVIVNDRVYCISEAGKVIVLAAQKEFKLLATNDLGELSRGTPAVADGKMYLRSFSHLISIGGKK